MGISKASPVGRTPEGVSRPKGGRSLKPRASKRAPTGRGQDGTRLGLVNGKGASRRGTDGSSPPRAAGLTNGSSPLVGRGRINGSRGRTNGGRTNGGRTNGGHTNGGRTNGGHTNGGRTNGGRTNGGHTNGGRTNGGRTNGGRTNGASLRPAAPSRRRGQRMRALSGAALGLMLFATLGAVLVPASAQTFVVDGHFGEWAGIPTFPGSEATPSGGPPHPTEVQVAARDQTVFVHSRFNRPLFQGDLMDVLRVFVDSDSDPTTGFDMGSLGADVLMEVAGRNGAVSANSLFSFDSKRSTDDWNGWKESGNAPFAYFEGEFEAQILPVPEPDGALILVTASNRDGDAIPPEPAAVGGALAARSKAIAGGVIHESPTAIPLVRSELRALGVAQEVHSIVVTPTGPASFASVQDVTLDFGEAAPFHAKTLGPDAATFELAKALTIGSGESRILTIAFRFLSGFGGDAGLSFGASVSAVEGPHIFLREFRSEPPAGYLGYVSPLPVVDGGFGEWALAGAQPEQADYSARPGLDIVGTRALWSGPSGAFFAETRGPLLQGAELYGLPVNARSTAPAEPVGATGPYGPQPESPPPAPALTADDRLFVYIDSDRNPNTGFQPILGYPLGAEYVIQVAGRFSRVTTAHLLAFAGSSAQQSAWIPRGTVDAIAVGASLEGEIPAEAVYASMGARLLFQTVDGSSRSADYSASLQEIEATGLDSDGILHFRMVTFDPLKGEPPLRGDLSTTTPSGYWVVQFDADAGPTAIAAVEAMGSTLYGYVHSNAYLARFPVEIAAAVRGVPGVRWVGVYQPGFKFGSDPLSWPPGPVQVDAILFERDPTLDQQVRGMGGTVVSASDRGARVVVDSSRAPDLATIPQIQFLDVASTPAPLNDVGRNYQGVNLTFEDLGLNGSGIVVGISDTGIDFTHPAFDDTGTTATGPHFDGRIVGYFRYGSSYGDLNGHGTHTAGSVAGDGDLSNTSSASGTLAYQFRGMAPAAVLVITATLAGTPPIDDQVFADQQVFGATVSSNSWGYIDNQQNPITDYDAGAYLTDLSVVDANVSRPGLQPLTIVFAAGNDGPGADSVGSPGTAKNVITVGASETDRGYDTYSDNPNSTASFSSRGPTDDSRNKPDVVAIGTYVLSTQSRTPSCSCTYGGWDQSWTGPNYAFSSGTSQATPQVSGMVALIQQHINDTFSRIPSPALVKAALINGAEDLGMGYEYTGGVTGVMSQGWGRVNVSRSIEGPPGGTILYEEEGQAIGTGDLVVHRYEVASAGTPLKVTLVWSDAPGNPGDTTTLPELVNNLDLTVRAPNGTYYHGNQFSGAWSRGNNSSFDSRNNVENVFVRAPSAGVWTVEVTGAGVKTGRQAFAMAVSGNLTEVGTPAISGESSFPGAPADSMFGWNVTVASVNGDAYSDIIVGAPGAYGGNGSVYLFFGGAAADAADLNVSLAGAVLTGAAGESFGWDVDATGDWDGDGTPDLLIGAPGSGKAYLFLGGLSWGNRTADITFSGSASDRFGEAVQLVDGLDTSDGAEAVVGAPRASSSAGRAYLFSGGSTSGNITTGSAGASPTGSSSGSLFGSSLSGGDFNGDGHADLAVGAPGNSSVRLFMGGVGLAAFGASVNFSGLPDTRFGHSVSLDGDLNGDGLDDLTVGAPLANASAGASYSFFGRSSPVDDRVYRVYFFDNMEGGSGLWTEMVGSSTTNSPWDLTSTTFAGGAATGHAWEDSLGNYNASVDVSIRFASGINLSGSANPVLSFDYLSDVEGGADNYDGFRIEYSVNGSGFAQLDASNTQGLYDTVVYDGPGQPSQKSVLRGDPAFTYDRTYWRTVSFNLSSLAGAWNVVFRFRFASDYVVQEDGIYIDNVAVRELNPSSPNFTAYGSGVGGHFGSAVATLPSASGVDGVSDLVVGAPYADSGFLVRAGAAFVFQGSPTLNGTSLAASAAAVSHGSSAGSGAGWSVHGLAGFNSSSAVRVFVGAPLGGNNQGGALVGNVSSAIPELSDLATASLVAVAIFVIARRRRR